MRRSRAAVLGVIAVMVLAAAPAARADESLTASGSIVIVWHGDPARGCAREGVCGVQGSLFMRPDVNADFSGFGSFQSFEASFTSTARLRWGAGECVDVLPDFQSGSIIASPNHGRLVGHFDTPPSSGRCAGPTADDLGRVAIPIRKTGRRHPTFDLRASHAFEAGPFTGTLISTLVLRPDLSANSGFSESSSGSGTSEPVHVHHFLLERVSLRYRVTSVPGSLDTAFSAGSDPLCQTLDACAATGSLTFSLGRYRDTLDVTAARVVRRRVSARGALADFRAGRLAVNVTELPSGRRPLPAQMRETFDGPGSCSDTVSVAGLSVQFGPSTKRTLPMALASDGPGDPLRTHCPGPSSGEPGQAFAHSSLPIAELLKHNFVVSLASRGQFTDLIYAGSRSGAINLALSLVKVHAGTARQTEESP